jgi:hypothetical protein
MLSPAKVATPATVFRVNVPDSVPPAGLVPIASVIAVPSTLYRLPSPSSTRTVTAGVMFCPTWVVLGCCKNASRTGTLVMLKAAEVAPVRPVAAAVSV